VQILKKYQLENGKLKLEINDLKKQIAVLTTSAQPKKGRRGRKTVEEAQAPEVQIAKYGAYFQVANEAWVEIEVFMKPCPDVDIRDAASFSKTSAGNMDRITKELFHFLPPTLRPAMQNDISMGKTVCSSAPTVFLPLTVSSLVHTVPQPATSQLHSSHA
jgi:hypothetical protein